jgi:hypothetical protein
MLDKVVKEILGIINSYPLVMYKIDANYINPPTYESDELYNLAKELEDLAYPTRESDYAKIYYNFFCPVKIKNSIIRFIPIGLSYLKKYDTYEIFINTRGKIGIKRGNKEADALIKNLLLRTISFSKFQINRGLIITIDYIDKHYLEGRVKLKYVKDPVITIEEAKGVLKEYKDNLSRKIEGEITLGDYLRTVRVIYEALGFEVKGELKDLYRRYADGRDCGMMELPLDDAIAFKKWLNNESYCGGHPFEVVRGGLITYGIHLYPPEDGRYVLSPGDYYEEYYKVVKEFLRRKIPFKSPELVNVLKVLTGLAEVKVNEINDFPKMIILYEDVRDKRKIKWKEIEEVEYRREIFRNQLLKEISAKNVDP